MERKVKAARFLFEAHDLEAHLSGLSRDAVDVSDGLGPATFQDLRWESALAYLRKHGHLDCPAPVLDLLRQGARSFGTWSVSNFALRPLAQHVLDAQKEEDKAGAPRSAPQPSPALAAWLCEAQCNDDHPCPAAPALKHRAKTITDLFVRKQSKESFYRAKSTEKWVMFALVVLVAGAITIPWKPSDRSKMFGAGLVVARLTGVGSLLWTAMLFLSMSRTLIKMLYLSLPLHSCFRAVLTQSESFHAFCGKMVLAFGLVHALAHLLSTYRVLSQHSTSRLNQILTCADEKRGLWQWLAWPRCPLERHLSYHELSLTLPSLTGYALLLTVAVMGYTARAKVRNGKYFDLFYYIHKIGMVIWIGLLLLHGSQGWFGIGVPLVVPLCTFSIGAYVVDAMLRLIRYSRCQGEIISTVIRPGKGGGAQGALTYVQVRKPQCLWWNFHAGMYAFVNMPEYSAWQWHPFTIVSGADESTVEFIVAGVGDWTVNLAQHCLDYKTGARFDLPMLVLDGPYVAPAVRAADSHILIAVGAGVGITPFLGLMARIIGQLEEDIEDEAVAEDHASLQQVHLFWMSRSIDEFLFGRHLFTRILHSKRLRSRIFLHLHLTLREPEQDAPAYLFREALRRQSSIDREAFLHSQGQAVLDWRVPCCWSHGVLDQDVFWVSSLVDAVAEVQPVETFSDHWAMGAAGKSLRSQFTEESQARFRGPLLSSRKSTCASLVPSSAEIRSELTGERSICEVHDSGAQPQPVGPWRELGISWDGEYLDCVPEDIVIEVDAIDLGKDSALVACEDEEVLMPIAFGRPDFTAEIQAVGRSWPGHNIDVFVCGKAALVESLRDICRVCSKMRGQRYTVHSENFASASS